MDMDIALTFTYMSELLSGDTSTGIAVAVVHNGVERLVGPLCKMTEHRYKKWCFSYMIAQRDKLLQYAMP